MGIELPHANRPPRDEDDRDPGPTGAYPAQRDGRTRYSSRPSAFGPPRMSFARESAPPSEAPDDIGRQTSEVRLKPARDEADEPMSRANEPRRPSLPSITTDIEQLLPISQPVRSLPKPPRVPTWETVEVPPPARSAWPSLGVFACALLASVGSILHYAHHAPTAAEPPLAEQPPADPAPPPPAPTAEAESVQSALLTEAEGALARGDDRRAEELFGHLLAGRPAEAAYGLARVRLEQGDLDGAEGWVQRALKLRSAEPSFHALHADILARRERPTDAPPERVLERSSSDPAPADAKH